MQGLEGFWGLESVSVKEGNKYRPRSSFMVERAEVGAGIELPIWDFSLCARDSLLDGQR
jgi:hypothetical protein